MVKATSARPSTSFKAKYHSLDLLLIDDIQFFAGKERTQEEFFNAFEALLAKRAHIIMTSDTYPKGLADIDERLISRFDSGLTVAIEPPELEMRVAILMQQGRAEARRDARGRRLLRRQERALQRARARRRAAQDPRLLALHPARKSPSSWPREALKDLLSIQNRQIGVENIQKTVADFYKIKVADMYSQEAPGRASPGRARSRCTWPRN